jgi:hypothetical protein
MPREISILSLFVPSPLLVLAGSILLYVVLDLTLSRLGIYRYVWHSALFRISLFTVVFALGGLWLRS